MLRSRCCVCCVVAYKIRVDKTIDYIRSLRISCVLYRVIRLPVTCAASVHCALWDWGAVHCAGITTPIVCVQRGSRSSGTASLLYETLTARTIIIAAPQPPLNRWSHTHDHLRMTLLRMLCYRLNVLHLCRLLFSSFFLVFLNLSSWPFDHSSIVAAACICQKHVTNVSKHASMSKAHGAMRVSLSCQKVILYSESAKTLY